MIKESLDRIEESNRINNPKLYGIKENRKPFFLLHQNSFYVGESHKNCHNVKE